MRTALAQKYPDSVSTDMAQNENLELATQVAELRADVRHVQADVTDIKADLRSWTQRMETGFEKVDRRFERVELKIDDIDKKFEVRFDGLDKTVQEIRLDVKESLVSAKLWAIGMYVALAGTLLYVIARAAKWI